ncbi:MAG: tRNA guanosine(34) transglycosylase Tgt [Pirellulaceae bacterium]
MSEFHYELIHVDKHCGARRGRLATPRGDIELPTFMPVGTVGSVKGLTPGQVRQSGAQIILGNTYHLSLRPGDELVAQLGGLHKFMHWDGPILTDSGGFQIFSLAKLAKVDEQGVSFRSHIDGALLELTPERSMEIQRNLGSDIAMVLDHLPPLPSPDHVIEESCQRTVRWAQRCRALKHPQQAMFGIVQGGLNERLRHACADELTQLDFDGYAIGGLSVGETPEEMDRITAAVTPHLPPLRPRYLMGVGRPEDLLAAIGRGVDMFDCVMPTRNGRNALAFTDEGPLRMRNLQHRDDPRPLDDTTPSPLRHFSRAYLRHLFIAGEMLGPIALSLHNLAYYQHLMRRAREAIESDSFVEFCRDRFAGWGLTPDRCPS